ncbi:hypothetical protein BJY16_005622 [Actinoplanes octamycinicus]|uniref:Uncharacterized protein n=1 Tax=Actinoplanes octamycinicus TaxID=135948 RepID=A0A7W7H1H1_9ACTN|nr:hypothetical protein [Actinoplanes octamycinicus]MBB4742163.1 hypothetical protein [Actinoplanes octamycinicus]GIE59991.1 hypothetical protein Aoc01nite_53930 [Actinoplanes octamycinicus]
MTAQSPPPPGTTPRKAGTRVLVTLVILALVSLWLFLACGEDWKKSLFTFEVAGTDYRVRVTGGHFGVECAKLERYKPNARYDNWQARSLDCAWPRLAGGDGWLGGGQAEEVSADDRTEGWIFYGIVPSAATEVVLTFPAGVTRRIPTKAGGDGSNRFYGHYQAGARAQLIGLVLHDAGGGELRVV